MPQRLGNTTTITSGGRTRTLSRGCSLEKKRDIIIKETSITTGDERYYSYHEDGGDGYQDDLEHDDDIDSDHGAGWGRHHQTQHLRGVGSLFSGIGGGHHYHHIDGPPAPSSRLLDGGPGGAGRHYGRGSMLGLGSLFTKTQSIARKAGPGTRGPGDLKKIGRRMSGGTVSGAGAKPLMSSSSFPTTPVPARLQPAPAPVAAPKAPVPAAAWASSNAAAAPAAGAVAGGSTSLGAGGGDQCGQQFNRNKGA